MLLRQCCWRPVLCQPQVRAAFYQPESNWLHTVTFWLVLSSRRRLLFMTILLFLTLRGARRKKKKTDARATRNCHETFSRPCRFFPQCCGHNAWASSLRVNSCPPHGNVWWVWAWHGAANADPARSPNGCRGGLLRRAGAATSPPGDGDCGCNSLRTSTTRPTHDDETSDGHGHGHEFLHDPHCLWKEALPGVG